MRPTKLYLLQVLRALAAAMVVWAHVLDVANGAKLDVPHDRLGSLDNLGALGVDLFFVLSGLVVSLSAARPQDPGRFLKRRFLRIYPLIAVDALLYAAVYLTHSGPEGKTIASRVAYSLFLLPAPTPALATGAPRLPGSWTLVHEVFFYFCLYLGLRARRWDARKVAVGLVGGMVLLNTVVYGVLHKTVPFLIYYGSPIALEFVFGVGLGWFLERTKVPKAGAWAMAGVGVAWFAATAVLGFAPFADDREVRANLLHGYLRVLDWGIPATLVVGGLASIPWQPKGAVGRAAVYAGDACYSIYLFQWLPLHFMLPAFVPLVAAVGGDLATPIAVFGVVLVGIAAYALIERPLTAALNLRFVPPKKGRPEPPLADAGFAPSALEPTLPDK